MSDPSVSVYRRWRVYINNVEYTYLSIDFEEIHPSPFPDVCTIVLNGQHNIPTFSVIEIERDGVLKFYGYTERPKWTSDVDTVIVGRCRKVIVWKKWTERFAEARGIMQGFFGITSPEEIFKFIVRCPISDVPSEDELWSEYPHQKIGWGMNPDTWTCTASSSSNGTDPNYARYRLLDFYWRNRGDDSIITALVPNATAGVMAWTEVGGAGVACVNNCSNDGLRIEEATNGDSTYDYAFGNLPATATGINDVTLRLRLKRSAGWFGWDVTVLVEIYDGTAWSILGYVSFNNGNYRYAVLNAGHVLDTVTKVNAAQVRLTKYAGPPATISCSCITLRVDYSANGSQQIGDFFEVYFGNERERVCGLIVQSRHSSDTYPRDYCIQKYVEGAGALDFTGFTEVDVPANHIVIASATHIDHDQYKDEDTYTYLDYGAGAIEMVEITFRYRTVTSPLVVDPDDAGPIYIPIMISNSLNDAYWHYTNASSAIWLGAWYRTSPPTGPCHFLTVKNGAISSTDYSANGTFATNTWYYIRVRKTGRDVYVYIYTSQADMDADTNRLDTLYCQVPTSDMSMRYLYAGVTWNTGTSYHVDGDIENFDMGDWVDILCKSSNTCQDIVHSWTPEPLDRIRIVITGADASHAWEISQIYVYECDSDLYRVCEE